MIDPPGNGGARAGRRRRRRREAAGDGRHEVLDGGRPLEPAEARHADGPRPADAAEIVAQHVDDHHVLGAVLRRGQQLAGERAVLVAGAAARPRALDRVGRDDVRRESRRGTAPARPRGSPAGAPGHCRGRSRDPARPRRGRETRRTATDRRSGGGGRAATDRRRRASQGGGSGWPGRSRRRRSPADRLDAGLVGSAIERGREDRAPSRPRRLPRRHWASRPTARGADRRHGRARRRAGAPAARRRRRARDPPARRLPVRRSQAIAQSWSASRSRGRSWSSGRRRRQPLQRVAELVARIPDEPAEERRGIRWAVMPRAAHRPPAGASSARATANGSPPAAGRSRTATGSAADRSSARCGRAGRSRAAPGQGGRGTPRRRRWAGRRRPPGSGSSRTVGSAAERPLAGRGSPGDDRDGRRAGSPRCRSGTRGAGQPASSEECGCARGTSGSSSAVARPGPANAITDVAGRPGRPRDAHPRRRPARRRRGPGPDRA